MSKFMQQLKHAWALVPTSVVTPLQSQPKCRPLGTRWKIAAEVDALPSSPRICFCHRMCQVLERS